MESWLAGLPQHGYFLLFLAVFLEAVGIPVPAALALLIAGGASARGSLHPIQALAFALCAMLLGDLLLFMLGRHTGWWMLGLLCRLSLNPESCILRSADSFHRHGRKVLLFAKFVPGINTMAPPLAGSMNMRFSEFARLDLAGATLYIGTYFSAGYLFADALGAMTRGYQAFGRILSVALIVAIVAYFGAQVWMWVRSRSLSAVPLVPPAEADRARSAAGALIYDVRSHGYYDPRAKRITGSSRLDPNALPRFDETTLAGKHVYLYCTCRGEATSVRVARVLIEKGVRTYVIRGGLRAWTKAGFPVEAVPSNEMEALPVFES